MNKKQLIITLVILLHFPVFVHAEIYHLKLPHKEKPGEFASPTGVFNFKLGAPADEEFITKGSFSSKSMFKNVKSGEFRNPSGIANQISNEFRGSGLIFEGQQDEFNSDRLISNVEQKKSEKELFKSPDQGEFKPSLPKKIDKN